MSLWVNRLRQLAFLPVALFFFSCDDEIDQNGFKNPNSKFDGKYIEIPLTTSNLLVNEMRTSNYYFEGEHNRFLLGRYEDPVLGAVTSNIVTQFFTSSSAKAPSTVTDLDSIHIELELDLSVYGASTESEQEISIYQLTDVNDIPGKPTAYFNAKTPPDFSNDSLITSRKININPGLFKDYLEWKTDNNAETPDTTVVLRFYVRKSHGFYKKLRDSFLRYSSNLADAYVDWSEFREDFPGIAIVSSSENNNMILGINPGNSRIVMHYHDVVNGSNVRYVQSQVFTYTYTTGYSMIYAERTGDVAALTPYAEQPSDPGNRYVQAGTGLVTKLDLTPFYEFAESVGSKDILINSAEIVIGDVASTTEYAAPSALALRLLGPDNHFLKYTASAEDERLNDLFSPRIVTDYAVYDTVGRGGLLRGAFLDNDSTYYVVSDAGSGGALLFDRDRNKYSGHLTLFFQRLYNLRADADRFRTFALFPASTVLNNVAGKSINRAIFPSDKVTLRIYYTEPTVNQD